MRFEAIEIRKDALYNFVIETRSKPDNDFRESIREQIREAMEALDRKPESYSVSIIQGREEETRERQFPTLEPGKNYLLFAIVDKEESGNSLTKRELEEQKEELTRGIFPPERSRVAMVLLHNSLVGVMITKKPPMAMVSHTIAPSKWGPRPSRKRFSDDI